MTDADLTAHAAAIVAAYVAHNAVPPSELPALIAFVYAALARLGQSEPCSDPKIPLEPAVPVKKSVTPDYIVCLEDGKKFRSLKRHLNTTYGLSPQQYREKWSLPADYPMVAPSYAAVRSDLAKKIGLGRKNGSAA